MASIFTWVLFTPWCVYNLDTAFPMSHERTPSLHSVLYLPELTTLNLCIWDLMVLESCFPQSYWSGLCSEIPVDGCVCGGFEVVADGRKYPSEDRKTRNCLTVFSWYWEKEESPLLPVSTLLYKELPEGKTRGGKKTLYLWTYKDLRNNNTLIHNCHICIKIKVKWI